jgi:hypothetical protein
MSDNRLNYDKTEKVLKQERNCINPDKSKKLNLHYQTNMVSDPCFLDVRTHQSIGPGNYMVNNHYHCETLIPDVVKTATNLPAVTFKNGHDVGANVVDESSNLRIGKTRKYPKCPNQLFARPYGSVPYMGRGVGDPNTELEILTGEATNVRRQCNVLSGVSIPHQFTPLIDHLSENVQNPVHLVEEAAEPGWIRGGNPSRLVVRDADYAARCGHAYMDKVHAGEAWEDKQLDF